MLRENIPWLLAVHRNVILHDHPSQYLYNSSIVIYLFVQSFEEPIMFRLVGLVCGLAIYNHIIISLPFPLALYKKILKRCVLCQNWLQIESH